MVVRSDDKVVQWKKLWQLLSGIHYATPNSTVRTELASIKTELLNGIQGDSPKGSSTATSPKPANCPDSLVPFIDKLTQYLDCSKAQTWKIFCGYLQNEYNGSIELLLNYLKTETNTTKLLQSIWDFQSLERMTLLKIVKNLLEFHKSPGHPFADEYAQILSEIGLPTLRKSYIDQLTRLIKADPPFKYSHGELFNVHNKLVAWTERKLRETTEILQILLLIVDRDNILTSEFRTLVELFKSHSFGRQQQYLDLKNNKLHNDLVTKIAYGEVALFMKCIDANTTGNTSDPDWITSVSSSLNEEIVILHQNAEHGPLLMTWMLMNFHVIELSDENEQFRQYRQYGTKAVQLGVFGYLQTMCTHPMYRDKSLAATIVCRTIYNQLAFLCDIFDSDRVVAQHKNIYELLSELLKIPSIARDFCSSSEAGARSLFTTAINSFPVNFTPLSMIAHSLSTTGQASNRFIREKLESLPIYTEYYNSQRITLKPSDSVEDEFVLTHDFKPFGIKIDYTIPAKTTATVTDKPAGTQIHFNTSLNYFNVLHHEINELLFDLIKRPEIDVQRKERVASGMKYLASTVRRIVNPRDIPSEMVHPTEMVFDILLKFKDVPNPPIELLAECMEVCAALVPMLQAEIGKRVINLDILPVCANHKLHYREYAHSMSFDTAIVGHYLVSFEKATGLYPFLSAYFTFLKAFVEFDLDETVPMELAGLIFLLREVFPFIHTWRFEHEVDRQRITAQVLQYFCDILQIADENVNRSILRNTCVYSLLHLDSGMTLLRIVALGNGHIEEIMQNESNWMTAENTSFNLLVRLAMTIFMHILRLRNRVADTTESTGESALSPLENVIYSHPKHVIPVVTGYMRNIFNRRLPILSCLLLRRFAIEFQMSLLACLDIEPSQIRATFLERLENELESDQLKIAVLEFVEACINKQPGMTEAFFKINYDDQSTGDDKSKDKDGSSKTTKNKDLGEGVLTFMTLYLDVVAKNPNAVSENSNDEGKLLSQIMSLFHSLWKNNMQTLVSKLLDDKDFWSSILNPLFGRIRPNVRVYSQLFNMIGLELYRLSDAKSINADFARTLDRFLEKRVFFDWVNDILTIPDTMDTVTDDTPDWLCRLQSFKDLFIIILRRENRHGIKVPSASLEYFTDQCLQRCTERIHHTDDFRPFIVLSELYLFLLLSHKHKYKATAADDVKILRKIAELLHELSVSYVEMHARAKESILATAFYAMHLFGDELNANVDITINFVESIVLILCHELLDTETAFKAKVKTGEGERKSLSFIMALNTLKSILNNFEGNQSSILDYLQANQIFRRILSCLHATLPVHSARKLSVEMLDMLNVLSLSPVYSQQLLHCELGDYLWLKLLPPKELASTDTNTASWQANEYWPIYRRGIQLVCNMVRQHGLLFASEAIKFVGVHEVLLMDSVLLAKNALDSTSLELTESALELVNELIKYEKQWRLEHQQSMINLMRCVQVIMDHAISLLYRPKILRRLLKETTGSQIAQAKAVQPSNGDNADDSDSFDDEIKAMNTLIRIVVICAKSLLMFSPTVFDLLTSCDFIPAKWQPLIEIQFNAPKLNVGVSFPQLSFGSVLNAAVIFTKALLLQQYTFDGVVISEIHDTVVDASPSDGDRSTNNSRLGRRRNCTTLSILSTSTSVASNEHLASLDVDLCFTALEYILTLLASQSLLAIKTVNLSQREKQLIKRELCTELSLFHDFVRKRIFTDESRDDPLRRHKYGIDEMESCNQASQPRTDGRPSIGSKPNANNSLRVKVTRKLHLTQQTPSPQPSTSRKSLPGFDMSHQFSPITDSAQKYGVPSTSGITGRAPLPSSTPAVPLYSPPKQATKRGTDPIAGHDVDDDWMSSSKYFGEENDPETQLFFEPEDPSYCELSRVRLVEEDYFHFLSNLFTYICQSENIN